MRLLESEVYRGRQIRVYLVCPGDLGAEPGQRVPRRGVRVDGQVVGGRAVLASVRELRRALAWGRRVVDREPLREV